ncbi:MAG: hypothetical protein FWF45_00605 [Coriobacteriia bacterium]|nr:hypothetical protein [Coriobacteriia bacterium]
MKESDMRDNSNMKVQRKTLIPSQVVKDEQAYLDFTRFYKDYSMLNLSLLKIKYENKATSARQWISVITSLLSVISIMFVIFFALDASVLQYFVVHLNLSTSGVLEIACGFGLALVIIIGTPLALKMQDAIDYTQRAKYLELMLAGRKNEKNL